jgi:hypothetical protein
MRHGFVSITPLRLDLTDDDALARVNNAHGSAPARATS